MFIRTENFQTFIRLYPVVTFILALQAVLWLFFSLPAHSVVLWRDTVTGYNLGVANGEWWRLITPICCTPVSHICCLIPCPSFYLPQLWNACWEKRIFFPLGPSRRAFYLWYELVFQRKPFIPHLGTSTRNTAH